MDLNAGNPWLAMDAYAAFITSGQDGNTVQPPPPIRVTSQSRGPSSAAEGPLSVHEGGGGHTRTVARGRRGRPARTRGPGYHHRRRQLRQRLDPPSPPPARGHTFGKIRADWTPDRTALFCKLYCMQLDNGNCTMGVMSKWQDLRSRFFAATGVMHSTEQFASKYRNLKKEWQFINVLRYGGSGLGRDANGNPVATEEWWK